MERKNVEIILVLLIVAGLCGSLWTMELRAEEPRRAIVAMEMMLSHNYVVPKIHAFNYYNKPPLFNWLLIASFKLTGSFSEVSVRLPSLLSFLLTAFLVFRTVRFYSNRQTGFMAAVLYVLSVDIFFYGAVDLGEMDLFLTLLMFVQAIAVFYYGEKEKWWQLFLVSYIATALGVLTKGAPILVIQALLLLVWFSYKKQFWKLFSIQHVVGVLVCAGILFSYFYVYSQRENVFVYISQLLNESTQRSIMENKWTDVALNMLKSPLQLFYISLPGSGLLLYVFNPNVRRAMRGNKLFIFAFVFLLVTAVPFFMSPSTANRYLYPVFPFIAIMGAIAYQKAGLMSNRKWVISHKALMNVFLFLAVARIAYDVFGIPYQQKTSQHLIYRNLSEQLLQHAGGRAIYLTGFPEKFEADPTLPFIKLDSQMVTIPPLVPYQLPYYITKATNEIMRYDEVPVKGFYYLTPADFLKDRKATVHYRFYDTWVGRELTLVTFE